MFKTLSGLTDNAFWRAQHQISRELSSIGAGRKRAVLRYIFRPPQGKGQATGGLCLPAGP